MATRRLRVDQRAFHYYFDADILGLAKVVAALRPDVTYPGDPGGEIRKRHRPPCPITDPSTPDLVWIPQVARNGWSIITRDCQIGAYPAERDAVIVNNAKYFAIASSEKRRYMAPTRDSDEPMA